jgi:hypothetical protein
LARPVKTGTGLTVSLLVAILALVIGTVASPVDSAENNVAFPLLVKPGKRYLEDSAGRPFLIHGDTAWSLIADLPRDEVERYLDDRKRRGFNTILVSLIEHRFATNAPANAYGEHPFHGQPYNALAGLSRWFPIDSLRYYVTSLATRFVDFTRPNEAYFVHADWVLRRAAEKGFLALLAPCYVGYQGGSHGWYGAMAANGEDRLRRYGAYLGRRYRDFDNILWVHAGDFNPPRKSLVTAVAEGIAAEDPRALHTAHGAPETAALDYWRGESWLSVNTVYTYEPVYAAALKQYARRAAMPFFLIESTYENEHDIEERDLRMQAYQALLSGAAGQVFGNNPIWHFKGVGLYSAPMDWRQALESPGARSMTHLGELFHELPWWRLKPDTDDRFLTGGFGDNAERAVAARSDDRLFGMVYAPSHRDITVDLSKLAGPKIDARWYDPAEGVFSTVDGSPFPAEGERIFTPNVDDVADPKDWVLLLHSHNDAANIRPPVGGSRPDGTSCSQGLCPRGVGVSPQEQATRRWDF